MITVVALVSKGITDNSLRYHIQNAKNHGVTKTEMVEIITHIAFYVGWPNAWAVFPMVREVYAEEGGQPSDSLFGLGEPNTAYAQYFIGRSYLKPLNVNGVGVHNVTFEPKCRKQLAYSPRRRPDPALHGRRGLVSGVAAARQKAASPAMLCILRQRSSTGMARVRMSGLPM